MKISHALSAKGQAAFETAKQHVAEVLHQLGITPEQKAAFEDDEAREILALIILIYRNSTNVEKFLTTPRYDLDSKTPFEAINLGGSSRTAVSHYLIRCIEGYVF